VDWWKNPKNSDAADDILSHLTFEKEYDDTVEQKFAGKTFVITGSLQHFANRNELKELIEKQGGKVAGSVSSKTSYLINNDATSSSTKNRTAQRLGVPIITEDEFMAL